MIIVLAALLTALQAAPAAPAQDAPESGDRVAVIPITGPLSERHIALVRRAAEEIRGAGFELVVFEIDTPGGRLDHMTAIGGEMVGLAPLKTAAFIRRTGAEETMGGAISAGVYLAISCDRIYMQEGTTMGASAPVFISPTGEMQMAPEKGLSSARSTFRARAEQKGYPGNLIVAMVDESLEIFEVEVDGKKDFVTREELEALKAEGKISDPPLHPYDASDKLLTLTHKEAADAGIAKIADTRAKIYEDLGLESPVETTIVNTWSEDLVAVLTSPGISFVIMLIGLLGVWVELKSPGFGVAGVIGVLALALFFFAHHLAGLAQAVDILLFVAGVALVAVEIFLLPGTGIFAVAGVICVFSGLVLSYQDFVLPDPTGAPWQVGVFAESIARVILSLVGAILGFLVIGRFLPKMPMANRLVLQAQVAGTAPAPAGDTAELVGRHGHAVTPLRPSGKIEIDGDSHDVVAEGEFIAVGEPVEVLRVDGAVVVVAKVKR